MSSTFDWLNAVMDWAGTRSVPISACRDDDGWFVILNLKGIGEWTVSPPQNMKGQRRERIIKDVPLRMEGECAKAAKAKLANYNKRIVYGKSNGARL